MTTIAIRIPCPGLNQAKNFMIGAVSSVLVAPIEKIAKATISSKVSFNILNTYSELIDNQSLRPKLIEFLTDYAKIPGNHSDLLTSTCPILMTSEKVNNYLEQEIVSPALLKSVFFFKPMSFSGPIIEEVLFRLLMQDLLLKRIPQFLLNKISPAKAAWFDSRNSKIARIAITSTLFAAIHLLNLSDYPLEDIYPQMGRAFVSGIAMGILKESYGFSAALGYHWFTNFMISSSFFLSC